MPANRIATSRIGSQVKPLDSRCSSGVSHSDSSAMTISASVAQRLLQFNDGAENIEADTGLPERRSENAGDDAGDQDEIDAAPDTNVHARAFSARAPPDRRATATCRAARTRSAAAPQRSGSAARYCAAVQKKSTPCRKPTNSGGSPSGVSAPPTLATRMMKNTMAWTRWRRCSTARRNGRIRIMAAPVVPTKLAIPVPIASSTVRLTAASRESARSPGCRRRPYRARTAGR